MSMGRKREVGAGVLVWCEGGGELGGRTGMWMQVGFSDVRLGVGVVGGIKIPHDP